MVKQPEQLLVSRGFSSNISFVLFFGGNYQKLSFIFPWESTRSLVSSIIPNYCQQAKTKLSKYWHLLRNTITKFKQKYTSIDPYHLEAWNIQEILTLSICWSAENALYNSLRWELHIFTARSNNENLHYLQFTIVIWKRKRKKKKGVLDQSFSFSGTLSMQDHKNQYRHLACHQPISISRCSVFESEKK